VQGYTVREGVQSCTDAIKPYVIKPDFLHFTMIPPVRHDPEPLPALPNSV